MTIRIFYDNVTRRIKNWRAIRNLLNEIILHENKIPGNINIILSDDNSIREINREFLNHDYNTDVISFQFNSGEIIEGEIYVSWDTVKNNAKNYKVSCDLELLRVIIHGVLHLCGYDDATVDEKSVMRNMENYWIGEFKDGIQV